MALRMQDSGDSLAQRTAGFANPTQNIIEMGINEGMRVADFGAGSGAYSMAAAKTVGKTGVVYAVDVQKDLLNRVKTAATAAGLSNIEIVWGDFEREGGSRIAEHSLDRVIMSNVLFQLENRLGAFHEARRVLKPDAKLVLIDWADSFGGLGPAPEAVVTKAQALKLASAAGFAVVKDFEAGAHHYGIILKPIIGV